MKDSRRLELILEEKNEYIKQLESKLLALDPHALDPVEEKAEPRKKRTRAKE